MDDDEHLRNNTAVNAGSMLERKLENGKRSERCAISPG